MKFRKATLTDLDDYLDCLLEAFPKESAEEHTIFFKQKIENGELIIAEVDDQFVGYIAYSDYISPPFKYSLYVEEMVVRKDFQNKGHGSSLLRKVIEKGKELGKKRVMLDTNNDPDNKAIAFYTKHGFKRVGNIKTKYGNKLFYELSLN